MFVGFFIGDFLSISCKKASSSVCSLDFNVLGATSLLAPEGSARVDV